MLIINLKNGTQLKARAIDGGGVSLDPSDENYMRYEICFDLIETGFTDIFQDEIDSVTDDEGVAVLWGNPNYSGHPNYIGDDWRKCKPEQNTHYHGGGDTCQCGSQPSVTTTTPEQGE